MELGHLLTRTILCVTNLASRLTVFPKNYSKNWWIFHSRSRWLCGLRRGSETTWFLGSRVRIPVTAWMFMSCVLCRAGTGICDELISRSEECLLQGVCLTVCDLETSTVRRPRPELRMFCHSKKERKKFIKYYRNIISLLTSVPFKTPPY